MIFRASDESIQELCKLLQDEEVVAIPTETVYGLGARADSQKAVEEIYELKGRPKVRPLSCLFSSLDHVESFLDGPLPEKAKALAERFWPGPLTLILPKPKNVPDIVTAGGQTLGCRVPDQHSTQRLIEELGTPLAAPSANPFQKPSPKTAEEVEAYFGPSLHILDDGPATLGLESTIVDFTSPEPQVLREGAILNKVLEHLSS